MNFLFSFRFCFVRWFFVSSKNWQRQRTLFIRWFSFIDFHFSIVSTRLSFLIRSNIFFVAHSCECIFSFISSVRECRCHRMLIHISCLHSSNHQRAMNVFVISFMKLRLRHFVFNGWVAESENIDCARIKMQKKIVSHFFRVFIFIFVSDVSTSQKRMCIRPTILTVCNFIISTFSSSLVQDKNLLWKYVKRKSCEHQTTMTKKKSMKYENPMKNLDDKSMRRRRRRSLRLLMSMGERCERFHCLEESWSEAQKCARRNVKKSNRRRKNKSEESTKKKGLPQLNVVVDADAIDSISVSYVSRLWFFSFFSGHSFSSLLHFSFAYALCCGSPSAFAFLRERKKNFFVFRRRKGKDAANKAIEKQIFQLISVFLLCDEQFFSLLFCVCNSRCRSPSTHFANVTRCFDEMKKKKKTKMCNGKMHLQRRR